MVEIIDGQEIKYAFTLGSWFDQDCIRVRTADKYYLMPCSTIIQMVNEFVFIGQQKRKHTWLTVALPKNEKHIERELANYGTRS